MFYRLKVETYKYKTPAFTIIGNTDIQKEKQLVKSAAVFVDALSHLPQMLDELVDKIFPVFVGVERKTIFDDSAEFFDMLTNEGFLVSGETYVECNALEYGWGYNLESAKKTAEATPPKNKAFIHLPGLFEHYDFYKRFLPIFYNYREFFYDFWDIGSIYGSPIFAIWNSGRARARSGKKSADVDDVLHLGHEYGIHLRFTFSNSLLEEKHLNDTFCNYLLEKFHDEKNGIIIASDLLKNYIKQNFPKYHFISSTTKCLNTKEALLKELADEDFKFVVPDYNFNNHFEILNRIPEEQRCKVEFLSDESCMVGCPVRVESYARISRSSLYKDVDNDDCFFCPDKRPHTKYFSLIKQSKAFIGLEAIQEKYLPQGFCNFKIEGREYGELRLFEELIYYLVKPEHQLEIREMMYLKPYYDFPTVMRK